MALRHVASEIMACGGEALGRRAMTYSGRRCVVHHQGAWASGAVGRGRFAIVAWRDSREVYVALSAAVK